MVIERDDTGRFNINTTLMAESLMDRDLLAQTERDDVFRPLPELNILKIGGQSIMDRGGEVLLPLLDELIAARADHQMLLMTGGGTRSRHAYTIGMDLGMPTGVLARLGGSVSEQNALMLSLLLAPHGGVKLAHEDVVRLPGYLMYGAIPVMPAMPPYNLWEEPPAVGRIPARRTDFGTYLLAETVGAKRCIFVKDEDGLYDADPKKNPDAAFIESIGLHELIDRDLNDLAVERAMLEAMRYAKSVKEVQIVNGRVRGNVQKALAGEHVGTRIFIDMPGS